MQVPHCSGVVAELESPWQGREQANWAGESE